MSVFDAITFTKTRTIIMIANTEGALLELHVDKLKTAQIMLKYNMLIRRVEIE